MDPTMEDIVRKIRKDHEDHRKTVEKKDAEIEMSHEELKDQIRRATKAVKFIYSKLPKLDKADSKRLARVKAADWDQVE